MNGLTLNELISETEKYKRLAYVYFNKFIKKKYNFKSECDDDECDDDDCDDDDDYNEFYEELCKFYIGSPHYNNVAIYSRKKDICK